MMMMMMMMMMKLNGYFVCILLVGCLVLIAVYSAKEPEPEMQATTVCSCLSGSI